MRKRSVGLPLSLFDRNFRAIHLSADYHGVTSFSANWALFLSFAIFRLILTDPPAFINRLGDCY